MRVVKRERDWSVEAQGAIKHFMVLRTEMRDMDWGQKTRRDKWFPHWTHVVQHAAINQVRSSLSFM